MNVSASNEQKEWQCAEASLHAGRIVALVAHRARRCSASATSASLRRRRGLRPDRSEGRRSDPRPCRYATEKGSYDADCGTLVVPENRADPHSRLIALPVTRIRARSAHPAEPIFRLQGGPGITNMTVPEASRFADDHDVVLVGYRGVDGSSRLDCPEVESALEALDRPPGEKSFARRRGRRSGRAPTDSPTTASTSPATASRSGSTISRPRARRSATSASTSSARAPARARR